MCLLPSDNFLNSYSSCHELPVVKHNSMIVSIDESGWGTAEEIDSKEWCSITTLYQRLLRSNLPLLLQLLLLLWPYKFLPSVSTLLLFRDLALPAYLLQRRSQHHRTKANGKLELKHINKFVTTKKVMQHQKSFLKALCNLYPWRSPEPRWMSPKLLILHWYMPVGLVLNGSVGCMTSRSPF